MVSHSEDSFSLYEIDSRMGLNGCKCHWVFPCLMEEQSQRFFVMLGEASIDKLTKSTFLNLVDFAEKASAIELVLVLTRDHPQKGNFIFFKTLLEDYKNLFKTIDAHRIGQNGMKSMIAEDQVAEAVLKFALFGI